MHAFVRNDRVMFGPLGENDLMRLEKHDLFQNHGICAISGNNGVEIFATLPNRAGMLVDVNNWFLLHHNEFAS